MAKRFGFPCLVKEDRVIDDQLMMPSQPSETYRSRFRFTEGDPMGCLPRPAFVGYRADSPFGSQGVYYPWSERIQCRDPDSEKSLMQHWRLYVALLKAQVVSQVSVPQRFLAGTDVNNNNTAFAVKNDAIPPLAMVVSPPETVEIRPNGSVTEITVPHPKWKRLRRATDHDAYDAYSGAAPMPLLSIA